MKSILSLNSIMDIHLYTELELYRVFNDVKEGSTGSWIEKESNLDQDGSCSIYDDARIGGSAIINKSAEVFESDRVSQNAEVSEHAMIYGDAKVSEQA